jgi:hypothetical protein
MKPKFVLTVALISLAVLAIVSRVEPIKKIVMG